MPKRRGRKPSKRPDLKKPHRGWVYTINNPTLEDKKRMKELTHEAKYHVAQVEVGKQGTPHIQGIIYWENAKMVTKVNQIIGGGRQPHTEVVMNLDEAMLYCSKSEGRIETIAKKGLKEVYEDYDFIRELRPWQQEIVDTIEKQCKERDRRTINWYWESKGNIGKSSFVRYMAIMHKAIKVAGTASNCYCALALLEKKGKLPDQPIILWDLDRSHGNRASYSAMEDIKNGVVFSGKFESGTLIMKKHPIICVFANEPPQIEKMSKDRWNIVCLNKVEERKEEQEWDKATWGPDSWDG